ncbi:Csa1 family protein, partial [Staphylococcus aureus]|uniref:Csa1 family protein n=1 Tax=Staphylococcus aureus TaxID=1280 RepID=UPI00210B2620
MANHEQIIETIKEMSVLELNDLVKAIEEFKFFVQYGNFKELENYKDGELTYNPEAPIYSAQYQLKNSDY